MLVQYNSIELIIWWYMCSCILHLLLLYPPIISSEKPFFFNTRDLRHQGLCIINVDVSIADDSEECIIYQWVSLWFQNHAASWFRRLTHLGLNWMVWYKKQESDLHIEWSQHIILMLPFYLWRQCSHFFFLDLPFFHWEVQCPIEHVLTRFCY